MQFLIGAQAIAMQQSILIDSVALERSRELLRLFVSLVLALPLGERGNGRRRRGADGGIAQSKAGGRTDGRRDEAGGTPQRRHLDQRRLSRTRGLLKPPQRIQRAHILRVGPAPFYTSRPPLQRHCCVGAPVVELLFGRQLSAPELHRRIMV